MKIELKSLAIELTRKCNMSCSHCMRGEAESEYISCEVLETLFMDVSRIDHLLLTGGEPSLAAQQLENLIHYAKSSETHIGHFFCAVNAKEEAPEFITAITELFHYCCEPEKCVLTVSTDQFHEPYSEEAYNAYRSLPFYSEINEKGKIPKTAILNEGRAADNGIGHFVMPETAALYDVDIDGFRIRVNDPVYINVFGDVLLDNDMCYAAQPSFSVGNIVTGCFTAILLDSVYKPFGLVDGCIYTLAFSADCNTVEPAEMQDIRYYKNSRKAFADYFRVIHNLYINPRNTEYFSPDDEISLSFTEVDESHYNADFMLGADIKYGKNNVAAGAVRIRLEQHLTEDAEHE